MLPTWNPSRPVCVLYTSVSARSIVKGRSVSRYGPTVLSGEPRATSYTWSVVSSRPPRYTCRPERLTTVLCGPFPPESEPTSFPVVVSTRYHARLDLASSPAG